MRLLALSLLTVLLAFGADVTGKWKASLDSQDGPREYTFTFHVTDGKLTGAVAGPHGEMAITEGKIDGDKVNFTVEAGQSKYVLSGTVSGDDLKLTGQNGEHNFELAAKRVKE
jgi:hypothetical protein